jgi:(p)ppGpp synthase/HD superfamily hydrolase
MHLNKLKNSMLDKAIALAVAAHSGQKDKYGSSYILHPIRLMMKTCSEEEMITAILHDVVEDTDWTFETLEAEGFSHNIIGALDCLTRRNDETYEAYIERSAINPLARKIKIADLEDNMDMKRLKTVDNDAVERLAKYHRAWIRLSGKV